MIFRRQLRDPHFFQNCGTFQYNNNYHNFERNDNRETVFLKWTDFKWKLRFYVFEIKLQKCIGFHSLLLDYPCTQVLTFIQFDFRGLRQKLHFDIFKIGLSTPKVISFKCTLSACPCHCLGRKFFVIHAPTPLIHWVRV